MSHNLIINKEIAKDLRRFGFSPLIEGAVVTTFLFVNHYYTN